MSQKMLPLKKPNQSTQKIIQWDIKNEDVMLISKLLHSYNKSPKNVASFLAVV
jgi:hypothetical protein